MAHLKGQLRIWLADDDMDDILLFQDAIEQLSIDAIITIVRNGEDLMRSMDEIQMLPDILFLDLNMPLRNGFECLSTIMQSRKLQSIPVVVFSTSNEAALINRLYKNGARNYISKPSDFEALKIVIGKAIAVTTAKTVSQPARDKFVLLP